MTRPRTGATPVTDITAKLAEALREAFNAGRAQGSDEATAYDWGSRASQSADQAFPDLLADWNATDVPAITELRAALTAYTASQSEPTFGPLDPRVHDLGTWEPARDEAALADLALDYLHLAQPEFCSARCPSVGREGEAIPHLPECVSMRSLLDGLPFATPGATISTGLMAKLKKLANYLTEQGEYEACDLIDTVVDRLSASPPTPARDDALEALRELSERATNADWHFERRETDWSGAASYVLRVGDNLSDDEQYYPTALPINDAAFIAAAVNYVRAKLAAPAQEPR